MLNKSWMSILILVAACGSAFAQNSETNLLPSARRADLSDSQARRLQQIERQPSSRRTELVMATPEFLSRLQNNQTIQIRPFNETAIALGGAADAPTASTFSWNGSAEAVPSSPSGTTTGTNDSVFVVTGDSVVGTIDLGERFLEVRPLGNGLHALTEVDRSIFPPEHPSSFQNRQSPTRDVPSIALKELSDTNTTDISVIVAYTNQVFNLVEDVKSLVDLSVAQTNRSYTNSGINIRLIVAGEPVRLNCDESGSYETDLEAFALRNDAKMDEIHSLRDAREADVMVLLVANSSYCGLARDIEVGPDAAFALVNYECATRQYSFAHEIGHLQGARHNPEVDATSGYAHGFTDEVRRRRTIMGYPCTTNSCPRELQWARPTEWGNADRSHDARRLNETANHVGSFRGRYPVADTSSR